ncbi:zona pellucida sperm-binding protein 4-like isoform X1 [Rana temporaria]|uniref:zona pellucida sperm-binding protein 4-like isoform X1 n=1 Tax=Rana temporaria TaxID=8407 RepID=UPI001AAC6767|nr:zona pellucida sperm-binding protein 4-like isoform X1 [Rana temporaria]
MGSSRTGMGLALLLWSFSLSWLLCEANGHFESSSLLHCALDKMELSFSMPNQGAASSLKVLDFQDEFQNLANDSACGLWVRHGPNNTMVIAAAYDGCYVREEHEEYMMVLLLEDIVDGAVEQYKTEKRCPIQNEALDAPSPDVCSAVAQEDKLSCADTPVTSDSCAAMGCCYSSSDATMPCFFGNKLTTQCRFDGNMAIAVSSELTVPSLHLDSVRVIGLDSCSGLTVDASNSFVVFRFPLSCTTAFQVPNGPMNYEATIEAGRQIQTWQGSSITRDSTMRVTVQCSFIQTGIVPLLSFTVNTLPPPLPVSTSGPLELEMRIAQDFDYASYYTDVQYPVVKVLRDPVYLEVRLIGRTDPNLVLVLNDCWATNSADPMPLPQWPILFDSCPFNVDNYLSQLIPVGAPSQAVPIPSYYQRFLVSTFTFVDSTTQLALEGLVYFHCSASVCVPSARDSCVVSCGQRRRRMAELQSLKNTVTSQGPVAFVSVDNEEILKLEGTDPSDYSTLDLARALATAGVVGSVAVAVLGLWMYRRSQTCNLKTANV